METGRWTQSGIENGKFCKELAEVQKNEEKTGRRKIKRCHGTTKREKNSHVGEYIINDVMQC